VIRIGQEVRRDPFDAAPIRVTYQTAHRPHWGLRGLVAPERLPLFRAVSPQWAFSAWARLWVPLAITGHPESKQKVSLHHRSFRNCGMSLYH